MSNEKNAAQETNQTAKTGGAKKALSVIGNIFIWLFIVFAVVVTVIAFAAKTENGVRSIGGKVVLTVQTPSMEPVFKAGDLIIGQRLDPDGQKNLKVDDIITFQSDVDLNGRKDDLITHRITEAYTDEYGTVFYRTKGDNNSQPDKEPVESGYVVCSHKPSDRIPFLGAALDFLNNPTGFLICVVLPLVLFFILELVSFIRKFLALKNEGKRQISVADEEEIRQRAVAEYLKAQAEKEAAEKAAQAKEAEAKEAEAKEAEKPAEAPAEEKPAEEAPAEAPAEEKPAEETPAEAPAEEKPAEEKPAEAPAEEKPAEETPAEATAEEKPAEETPAAEATEEEKKNEA